MLMSYVTPVMAISTAVLSLIFDPWHEFGDNSYFDSSWHITRSCLLMLFGGTLAFFMVCMYIKINQFECLIIQYSSGRFLLLPFLSLLESVCLQKHQNV